MRARTLGPTALAHAGGERTRLLRDEPAADVMEAREADGNVLVSAPLMTGGEGEIPGTL